MKEAIVNYFEKEIGVIRRLNYDEIAEAVECIKSAYEREATIYVFGNGGSAATASHFVCDFNKGISEGKKKKYHMVCLSDNTPIMTAIANDYSYDEIFRYQLRNVLKKDDLIIAISGSGNSKNIVNALEYAKEIGTTIIGITGFSGGKVRGMADYNMHVPVDDMQIAEDLHMVFDHMMFAVLKGVFKEDDL